jgi:glycosyltransferase involved in cell wall biosynthesis
VNLLFATNGNPYGRAGHGGAETSIRLLARSLAARGHRVCYLTDDVATRELDAAASEGVALLRLPRRRDGAGSRWRRRLATAATMARIFRRRRIDVYYGFYELELLRAALLARRFKPDTRIVMRMAGLHWYEQCRRDPKKITAFRRVFNSIDAVNFIEPTLVALTEEKLAELPLDVTFRSAFVADIGTDAVGRRPSDRTARDGGPVHAVMAARFSSYQKRQDLLVGAVARVPNLHLTLVGNGGRRDAVTSHVARLGITERVRVLPFMDQHGLWDLLSDADLLCHCVEYEGLGKTVVEAMSLGVPVLASNVPVLNAYIADGTNGFLTENTVEAWAGTLERLAADRPLLRRTAVAAREQALSAYAPERNVEAYEAAFTGLIADR